jgi:hypothetical protein
MKANRMAKVVLLVTALFLLAACASGAKKAKNVVATCDDFKNEKSIAKVVEVAVGDTFNVTLCSDVIFSGFKWGDSQVADSTVVEEVTHEYKESVPRKSWDNPGNEIWLFSALQAGQTTVGFENTKADEKKWDFSLSVTVK